MPAASPSPWLLLAQENWGTRVCVCVCVFVCVCVAGVGAHLLAHQHQVASVGSLASLFSVEVGFVQEEATALAIPYGGHSCPIFCIQLEHLGLTGAKLCQGRDCLSMPGRGLGLCLPGSQSAGVGGGTSSRDPQRPLVAPPGKAQAWWLVCPPNGGQASPWPPASAQALTVTATWLQGVAVLGAIIGWGHPSALQLPQGVDVESQSLLLNRLGLQCPVLWDRHMCRRGCVETCLHHTACASRIPSGISLQAGLAAGGPGLAGEPSLMQGSQDQDPLRPPMAPLRTRVGLSPSAPLCGPLHWPSSLWAAGGG